MRHPSRTRPAPRRPRWRLTEPAAPRMGKLMIMSPGERPFDAGEAGAKAESERPSTMFGKRRVAAFAAVMALAAVAGALGGALATTGLSHVAGGEAASAGNPALETSVARIENDILALKAGVEHSARTDTAQFNKTSDRLDKLEKAQAEPAAKLAKLSEAVDKLRARAGRARRRRRHAGCGRRKSPARLRPPRHAGGRAEGRSGDACRRSTAGCCATSAMAAP